MKFSIIYITLLSFMLISAGGIIDYTLQTEKKIHSTLSKFLKSSNFTTTKLSSDKSGKTSVWEVRSQEGKLYYLAYRETAACDFGGCMTNELAENLQELLWSEYNETVDLINYVLLVNSDLSIERVKVLEYSSSYGYEITAKSWLKKFIGLGPQKIQINRDIDAISGATISTASLVSDINETLDELIELKKKD